MDIYSFINSRDVAEHCRKKGKTWNTFEMAAIIYRSNCTAQQKHGAWQELIDHYPDAPASPKILPRSNVEYTWFDSIHSKLAEIIKYEQRLFERFKTPESGAVYEHKVWWVSEYRHSDTVFSTFEKANAHAHDHWERDEAPKIVFNKKFIDGVGDDAISIEAWFDYGMNLLDISLHGNENLRKEWFPDIDFGDDDNVFTVDDFQWFYLDIPTPFKRGDILTNSANSNVRIGLVDVFVLECLDRDDKEAFERHLKWGDSSDMTGWGYGVSDDGVLYRDHIYANDNLEYYRGKLEGNDRLLHYVSLFLGDKIDLPEILTAQCRIIAEHQLNDSFLIDTLGRYNPDELLAENRTIVDEK